MLRSVGWVPPYRCPSRRLLRWARLSGCERDEARDGPGEGGHLAGNGYHDLVDVLAPGGQLPIPFAQAHLRLPADRLDLGRQLLQAELKVPADLGGIPVGPRPFYQRAPGVAVPRLRDAALAAPLTRR